MDDVVRKSVIGAMMCLTLYFNVAEGMGKGNTPPTPCCCTCGEVCLGGNLCQTSHGHHGGLVPGRHQDLQACPTTTMGTFWRVDDKICVYQSESENWQSNKLCNCDHQFSRGELEEITCECNASSDTGTCCAISDAREVRNTQSPQDHGPDHADVDVVTVPPITIKTKVPYEDDAVITPPTTQAPLQDHDGQDGGGGVPGGFVQGLGPGQIGMALPSTIETLRDDGANMPPAMADDLNENPSDTLSTSVFIEPTSDGVSGGEPIVRAAQTGTSAAVTAGGTIFFVVVFLLGLTLVAYKLYKRREAKQSAGKSETGQKEEIYGINSSHGDPTKDVTVGGPMQNPTYEDSAEQTGIRIGPSSAAPLSTVPRPKSSHTETDNKVVGMAPDEDYDVAPPAYAAVKRRTQERKPPVARQSDVEEDSYYSLPVTHRPSPLYIHVMSSEGHDGDKGPVLSGDVQSTIGDTYGRLDNTITSTTSDGIYNNLTR